MIDLAVVVPQPPLLVPELVGAVTGQTEPLRSACAAAVRELPASGIRRWLAVGTDVSGPRRVPATAYGSFAGYGVHVPVSLGPDPDPAANGPPELPLPLLVAGWLRTVVNEPVTVVGELLHPTTTVAECLARGRALADELTAEAEPVGLLILGDGARTHPAPGAGRVDGRAGPFDDAVRAALAAADAEALTVLDAALAADLGVTGRPSWQLLAGVALQTGAPWRGRLLYSAAPYGVAYHVAVWQPAS